MLANLLNLVSNSRHVARLNQLSLFNMGLVGTNLAGSLATYKTVYGPSIRRLLTQKLFDI